MSHCKHPEGCPEPTYALDWCEIHYQRTRRVGDPGALLDGADGRTCKACNQRKPWSEFYKRPSNSTGYTPRCKPCHVRYKRDAHLRKTYGITLEDFDAALSAQGGVCANPRCDVSDGGARGWCVDHDHDTGAVRGILCRTCNLALGHAQDSPEIILGLYEYIVEHRQLRLVVGGQEL